MDCTATPSFTFLCKMYNVTNCGIVLFVKGRFGKLCYIMEESLVGGSG